LRQIIVCKVALTICTVIIGAQPAHPHTEPPLEELQIPHIHAAPAPSHPERASEIIFDATTLGSPLLLDKAWRVGITANPAPAYPEFDDSKWAIRDATESFAEVPDEDHLAGAGDAKEHSGWTKGHQRPFAWFRLHIKLAPHHGSVVLLIELPPSGNASTSPELLNADVFANGRQIRPEGPHADVPARYQQISRIYNLNLDPSESSLTLAVRTVYFPFGIEAYTNFFANRKLRLGNREDLDHSLELWSAHNLFERLPRLVNAILLVVLALFLLALYFTQKGRAEYLLLAFYELFQAPIAFLDLTVSTAHLDHLWYQAIILQLLPVSAYLYFEFLVAFLSLRRRWYICLLRYSAPFMAGIGLAPLFLGQSTLLTITLTISLIFSAFWIVGWLVFIFTTLIAAALRRNIEAGLLLIPLLLSFVAWIEALLTTGMSDLGGRAYRSPLTLQAGPIPIRVEVFADFAGIFVIVLIVFVRFLRVQRDQQRASSELAAARSVQELMIPQERLVTPGFEVVSIYNPANEVGGDFYHVQSTTDGGLHVIIGDVAGKGLKAAMNVSMLMGALRGTPERSPAKILESLNRVLVGSDSFTTCQAAWFGPNGELVIANAGHLPPYLNSQEVALPGGLPLGVLAEVSYDEVQLYLHPGDRILLMSDGVVEARHPSGELFGFDRVHNLSNQTAFYIADAAKEFGQEDDITVLTIRRLAPAIAA
jgi:phosphoserine phosphatase RsbU/P